MHLCIPVGMLMTACGLLLNGEGVAVSACVVPVVYMVSTDHRAYQALLALVSEVDLILFNSAGKLDRLIRA